MKKILFLLLFLPFLASSQKEEKQKLKYDTLTKTLTRERTIVVSEVIDTARLYSEDTRLTTEIEALQARRDSVRAQIKTARKLITGKKGNGNNRAAEAPPLQITLAIPCDSTYTFENGPVTVCWHKGVIQKVSCEKPYVPEKPKATKPKSKTGKNKKE
jgi:hypothetical protein